MPEFTKTQRIALASGIGIALIALAVVAIVRGCAPERALVVSATAAGPVPDSPPSTVTVHVKGAVAREGLYRLASGARVADAIALAGGATQEADLQRLNLAAFLTDGQQVEVPRALVPSSPTAPATTPRPAPVASPPPRRPAAPAPARLNVNYATPDQLAALPQIGPVLAERIVRDRQQSGPFRSPEDLARVEGIGPGRVEALRPYITF